MRARVWQGATTHHMVLVYAIPNKIHAILPINVGFESFWACYCNFWKIGHATSQYYVPTLKSDPNFGGANFITFIRRICRF